MQRGIKQASDAYARVAASVGSLERIVELHDRGVFRDAAHALGVEELPVRLCGACATVVGQVLPDILPTCSCKQKADKSAFEVFNTCCTMAVLYNGSVVNM